ncbi:hydrogenase nickel incorporation protein HypB [bacterium]|nr:MAG: hydrogenase nickel incorporation protein HypB [bacterium]
MREIAVEKKVLGANDAVAARNRRVFAEKGAYVINMISSPGTGKTTTLEATLGRLVASGLSVAVIEGDVQTRNDADRVEATGVPVEAVITGGACHLDAQMVGKAYSNLLPKLPETLDLLIVENVGNLVCPSAYDVGEHEKVALVSVTEGEDKPLKYPSLFNAANTCLVTKIDLLPYLDFDFNLLVRNIKSINPNASVFPISAKTGEGMEAWISYLGGRCAKDAG